MHVGWRLISGVSIALGVSAVIVYCALTDPAVSVWAPKCMWKQITGFDCPGCGFQRAVHALCHGEIAAAWKYNAFIFFALPLAALYALTETVPKFQDTKLYNFLHHYVTALALAAAIVAWWILRNLL